MIILLLTTVAHVAAQTTKVRGKVVDASTGEELPMCNLVFSGTNIGTASDMEGNYSLETREKVTAITVAFLGYETQTIEIVPGTFNTVNISLVPQSFGLDEVVVTPGENPAHFIMKQVSRHKKQNNPAEKESYSYTSYTKMELDATHIKPEFKSERLQRNFGFIFNYMDTLAATGQAYLPVMITESTADYYYRKSPRLSREVVTASRISGIEEDYTFAQFTGQLHVNVNLYDNYSEIFEVNFASPLCDHGLVYYKYYLIDSLNKAGRKIYHIHFLPKNKENPVFEGDIYIDSLSWALESASMQMVRGVNVNWIRDLVVGYEAALVNDSIWFPKQNRLLAHFSIEQKKNQKFTSFVGQRQIDYSHVKINEKIPDEVERFRTDVIIDSDVLTSDESYWQTVRPYELSEREKGIYSMVDSIKGVPLYQNIYNIINTAIFGYYDLDKFEIGPYYKLFSFNDLEGARFQFGGRTTTEFSKKYRLSGYAAYGTKDHKLKGGASLEYQIKSMPTSQLTLSAKHDVMQLGASENALSTGNILGSVLSRGNDDKLTLINQYDLRFEQEWWDGFSNTFGVGYRKMQPTDFVEFIRPDSTRLDHISTSQLRLGTRLSWNEVVVRRDFGKSSMGSDYPIVGLDFTMGLKNVINSNYEYYRLELTAQHDFSIAPLGYSNMIFSGGKIFGKVPYPLLKLHEGNATYIYDPLAFSCMDFYEFASDLWASVHWEHHFKGFFLGKIPLMKRLKWREVATVKALWGRLADKNNGSLPGTEAELLFPQGMSSVSKPYIEAGVGVENILRLIRIDGIWRLTHRDRHAGRNVDNFALNISLHFNF